jgi:hypothetical protein
MNVSIQSHLCCRLGGWSHYDLVYRPAHLPLANRIKIIRLLCSYHRAGRNYRYVLNIRLGMFDPRVELAALDEVVSFLLSKMLTISRDSH